MSARSSRVVASLVLVLCATAPALAYASGAAGRTVTTVTAGEVAGRLAGQVRGVELGSSGATITMEVNGKSTPLRVEYGEIAKSVEGQGGGGWLTLAAIPMVGASLVKMLNFLAKLGRG